MTCVECQDWVQRLLDGEAHAHGAAVAEHVAACATCRQLHASAQLLLKGLRDLHFPRAGADLAQRLTALVLADRQARQWRARYRLLVTAALAACILIMALGGYFLLPVPRDGQSAIVEKKSAAPQNVADAKAAPRWAESVDNARQAVTALSERWANRAKDDTTMFFGAAGPAISKIEDVAPLTDNLQPAAQSLQQMGHGLTAALQPVAASTKRAFAYLYHDLPTFEGKQ